MVPYNAAGDGVYKEFAAYVGEDLPGAPQNVTLTTHGGNAEITWAAPAEGKHGGYFDNASVKYNVVRMPDNKVVVEGTTSLRATDAVSVKKGYSYVVTAVNKKGVGASATSKTMSFGPEDSVPFTSPLTTQDDFDRWVTADKNNDGNTWTFYKPTQTTTYDRCDQNADDWLYTPALKFEKCKTYQVRYTYSSANWVTPDKHEQVMEQMKVWFCAEPIVTGAAKHIKETGEFHTASNIFLYGKDNFQTETTGSARIAFQACSEANHGQIYLKDVSIREYSTKDLSVQALTGSQLVNSQSQQTFTVDVRNEDSTTVNDYRVLLLNADANVWGELLMPFISIAYKDNGSTGIFAIGGDKNGVTRSGYSLLFDECADEARLYSATGALVASAQRANALSVAGLAKGIYVLKLTKGGAVRSLKVEF